MSALLESSDVVKIARGLSKAQRDAVLVCTSGEPSKSMPWLPICGKLYAPGVSHTTVSDITALGIWEVPMCTDPRGGAPIYHIVWEPLGLAVKAHLEATKNDVR